MKYFAASAACGSVKGNPSEPADAGSGTAGADLGCLRPSCLKRDDLGAGRVSCRMEVEGELTMPLRRQTPQKDAQRRPALQFARDMLDRRQVGERVFSRVAGPIARPARAPTSPGTAGGSL